MSKFDFSIIRTLRIKLGITADQLAKRANLTRVTVANLETGGGNPTIETIDALSKVFQLPANELVRLAEVTKCEVGHTEKFKKDETVGTHIWFPNFEIYHLKAPQGARKEADPKHHENTAEICVVLSGKLKAMVGDQVFELGPGMALRFRALHDHYFDVISDSEFLLIHHNIV